MTQAGMERPHREGSGALSLRAKRPLSVDVMGKRFTIVSDASEERVRTVVARLNRHLEETRRAASRSPSEHIAILAALNLTEALFDAETELSELKRQVGERSRRILYALDTLGLEVEDGDGSRVDRGAP